MVKVDEGVKKRNKLGLVAVNIKDSDIIKSVNEFIKKGYGQFLVEEFIPHAASEEKFMALERTRDGILCHYSNQGGVNIEDDKDSIKEIILTSKTLLSVANDLSLDVDDLGKIVESFDKFYLFF